jgi:hypothetical protein
MTTTTAQPVKSFDYRTAATTVLKQLKRERDRQILAKRFGFENGKRQTLEEIGRTFGITRERVRQIEKSTLIKISQLALPEVTQTNELLTRYLEQQGGIVASIQATEQLGAATASDQQAVIFMATLVPDVVVIDEDDQVRAALALADKFDQATVRQEVAALAAAVAAVGKPVSIEQLAASVGKTEDSNVVLNLAGISKGLAELDGQWGLLSWPSVNPKSIRDKTYLVLGKHGKPLHFTEISKHIADSSFTRRSVTVQAVHNELIKDSRFVLIGRGIYALAEWGYTPGTVADIISEVLRAEAPLHKDEIIKRVLRKRQVRTTTIILNLQEKEHFVRVAKATYKLKDQ